MAFPNTGLWIPNITQANNIDWTNLKAALVKSTWNPSIDSTYGYGSLGSDEASGTGYTAGGKTLTGVTVSRTGGKFQVTADDLTWSASTLTDVQGMILYCPTATTPVANAVVAVYKFSTVGNNTSGTFTVPWLDSPATNTVVYFANPGV